MSFIEGSLGAVIDPFVYIVISMLNVTNRITAL